MDFAAPRDKYPKYTAAKTAAKTTDTATAVLFLSFEIKLTAAAQSKANTTIAAIGDLENVSIINAIKTAQIYTAPDFLSLKSPVISIRKTDRKENAVVVLLTFDSKASNRLLENTLAPVGMTFHSDRQDRTKKDTKNKFRFLHLGKNICRIPTATQLKIP